MAWSDAARAAALEVRRRRTTSQTKKPTLRRLPITKHPMYSVADHSYLRKKGYTDADIRKIWDRDHASGGAPQLHLNKAPKRPMAADRALKRLMGGR